MKLTKLGWIEIADIPSEKTKIEMYCDGNYMRVDAVWRELDWKVLMLRLLN